jgi:23S rRNA (cytosine1962-C5)-methyltransferase
MNDLFGASNRRRLKLKGGKDRVVANRHPWIFGGAIAQESGPVDAAIGDLLDERGKIVASGFYSPHSQIRLRALTFGEETLTEETLRARVVTAVRRRRFTDDTNASRIVNSEGDDLSGLVVDRYDDLVGVEIANAGLDRLKDIILDALRAELKPRGIFLKNDLPVRALEHVSTESEWIGEGEPRATIRENGLRFTVDAREGQKTGFFLDQRENRALTRELSRGRRVLNLFSYSGAFGVYAAAGGAADVENVDVSAPAIELARANHEANGFSDNTRFTVADCFSFVRQRASAGMRTDLVICDPPAFAKTRGDVDKAARGYKDINLYALRLIGRGGMLMTFSCSGHMSADLFQKVIFSAALDARRRVSFVRRLTAAPDHPVSMYCPEGEYLKGFLLEVHD